MSVFRRQRPGRELGPPLAITREQVDEAVSALGDAIAEVTRA